VGFFPLKSTVQTRVHAQLAAQLYTGPQDFQVGGHRVYRSGPVYFRRHLADHRRIVTAKTLIAVKVPRSRFVRRE
jgi:hypothetical protein